MAAVVVSISQSHVESAAGPFGGLPFVKLSAVRDKIEIRFYRVDQEKWSTGGMNGLRLSFS